MAKSAPKKSAPKKPVKSDKNKLINSTIISDIELSDLSLLYMKEYGDYVVKERALPDFRDGLKPVQRRIIWAAHLLGLNPGGGTKKCARVVADAMGKFHPHGNTPIYGALTNMAGDTDKAHNINTSVPLILGQGGLGYINSEAAADRYTECKLSYYSERTLLNRDYLSVTEMNMSYDGDNKEPLVLPALLPNILLNGSAGIAVGVTCFIPPFEKIGVMKLVEKAISGSKITPKDCKKHLNFNFKYGGNIVTTDAELLDYYTTGTGRLKIEPKWECSGDTLHLLDATPYFTPSKVFNSLMGDPNKKTKSGKINIGVAEVVSVSDVSDDKEPFKMRIVLKKGLSPTERKSVIDEIIKKVSNTVSLKTNVIEQITPDDIKFRGWNVPTVINEWVKWRIGLEKKAYQHIYDKIIKDINHLKLMIFACDNLKIIFEVLKMKTGDMDAILAKKLKISIEDAQTILDKKARQLSAMSKTDLAKKIKDKMLEAKAAKSVVKNPSDNISKALKDVLKKPALAGFGMQ